MKKWGLALLLLIGAVPAYAASVPLVNPAGLQIPATGVDFNNVIQQINLILSPLTGVTVPNGVNAIGLTEGITGVPAIIGLQTGGDTNAGIQILPNGSGNIILFGGGTTGVIQIANATGWYPARGAGVVPCPGGGAGAANLAGGLLQATQQTVAGYEVHEDWLGRPYWVPGCR